MSEVGRVMATKTTETAQDGLAVLAGVIRLLDAAADRCLRLLAAGPPSRPEEAFALSDVGLAAGDVDLGTSSLNQDDPVELVRAAEALTRTAPLEAQPEGSSYLVVALCDLLREHG